MFRALFVIRPSVRCAEMGFIPLPAFTLTAAQAKRFKTVSGFSLFAFTPAALTIALPRAPARSPAIAQPQVCPVFMSKKSKKKAEKLARKAAKAATKSSKRKGSAKAKARKSDGKPAKKLKAGMFVYVFGKKKADGNGSMKALLGGKGANLAEMTRIGLPVPPGFTISTELCTYY